jgi:hypothetical protein
MNGKKSEHEDQEGRRAEILSKYAATEDPSERQRLAKAWLDAGGREVIDNAAARGLAGLRERGDGGDPHPQGTPERAL